MTFYIQQLGFPFFITLILTPSGRSVAGARDFWHSERYFQYHIVGHLI